MFNTQKEDSAKQARSKSSSTHKHSIFLLAAENEMTYTFEPGGHFILLYFIPSTAIVFCCAIME